MLSTRGLIISTGRPHAVRDEVEVSCWSPSRRRVTVDTFIYMSTTGRHNICDSYTSNRLLLLLLACKSESRLAAALASYFGVDLVTYEQRVGPIWLFSLSSLYIIIQLTHHLKRTLRRGPPETVYRRIGARPRARDQGYRPSDSCREIQLCQ